MSGQRVRDAVVKLETALAESPGRGRNKNSWARATLQDGLSFRLAGPNGESVTSDMPPLVGGTASAPPPGWLLRAALASCTGTVIALRAARLGVELDLLEVTVESESDHRGMLGTDAAVSPALSRLHARVRIGARGAAPAMLREIVEWGHRHSPVSSTLGEAQPIGVDIEIA